MRKVLVSTRLVTHDTHREDRLALDLRWLRLLEACGYLPIIAPFGLDARVIYDAFKPDALLLTGGNDLAQVNPEPINQARDDFEETLVQEALRRNCSIVGVCRGMQLINAYFGGTLKPIKGHIGTRHTLSIMPSRFTLQLEDLGQVNAFHGFAIDVLGQGLKVVAYSQDGCIKALEHESLSIFAMMWHSERQEPFCVKEIRLLSRVLEG